MDLTLPVPNNPKTATQFLEEIATIDRLERDERVLDAFLSGHVPPHIRTFAEISTSFYANGACNVLKFNVLPDVVSIGTADDYVRFPLTPLTAQRLCDKVSCSLPTTKISDLIWRVAQNKLEPLPWGPPYDASMMSTERIVAHNGKVQAQLVCKDVGSITAGHKKDIVLTNLLASHDKSVAIYGWHRLNGVPIQPLYLGHENLYADYAHSVRLVSLDCTLNDQATDLHTIFQDPTMCVSVSNEGPLRTLRQPHA